MTRNLETLEKKIKIKFKKINLLKQALTHRSYINEHPEEKLGHNERLEFLGDAVIEFVVTEHLYKKYKETEGVLTAWRSALVNTNILAKISKEILLDKYLFLSCGERACFLKNKRVNILADTFEALIGAIYLDQGLIRAKKFISERIISKLPSILENKLYQDSKSRLQELAQAETKITPSYRVLEETGPDHEKEFMIGVFLGEKLLAKGKGKSKQEAETAAAGKALEKYKNLSF